MSVPPTLSDEVSVQLEGRGTPRAVKLLLDENLSPSVAKTLCSEDGIDACHVRDRAMLGWEDSEVLERAFTEDRLVVTCNVVDFVALARARELHAGIVLIDRGSLVRDEQLTIIRAAVAAIKNEPDMVNRVVWVGIDGKIGGDRADLPQRSAPLVQRTRRSKGSSNK